MHVNQLCVQLLCKSLLKFKLSFGNLSNVYRDCCMNMTAKKIHKQGVHIQINYNTLVCMCVFYLYYAQQVHDYIYTQISWLYNKQNYNTIQYAVLFTIYCPKLAVIHLNTLLQHLHDVHSYDLQYVLQYSLTTSLLYHHTAHHLTK